jgi:hypothetical protein
MISQFVLAYLTDRLTAHLNDVVLAVYDQFDVELSRWSILRLLQRRRGLERLQSDERLRPMASCGLCS